VPAYSPCVPPLTLDAVARDEDAEEGAEKKGGGGVVQASGAAHTAACVALQRSPALQDFILTVGDWTFCIFKTGVKVNDPPFPSISCSSCSSSFSSCFSSSSSYSFSTSHTHARADAALRLPLQPKPPYCRPLVQPSPRHYQSHLAFILSRSPTRPSVILIAKADGSME
jgi:hypothetical protein